MTKEEVAQDVLDHSENADEWSDESVRIDSRPSGSQVVSVRLHTELAQRLFEEAALLEVRPSELVRVAVERLLSSRGPVAALRVAGGAKGWPVRILTPTSEYRTENANLVVEEPRTVEALDFEQTA